MKKNRQHCNGLYTIQIIEEIKSEIFDRSKTININASILVLNTSSITRIFK